MKRVVAGTVRKPQLGKIVFFGILLFKSIIKGFVVADVVVGLPVVDNTPGHRNTKFLFFVNVRNFPTGDGCFIETSL